MKRRRAGCPPDSQQDAGVTLFQMASWRLDEGTDIPFAVGLDDILEDENAVVIIEWAEKLGGFSFPSKVFSIKIEGDGYEPRAITIDCH